MLSPRGDRSRRHLATYRSQCSDGDGGGPGMQAGAGDHQRQFCPRSPIGEDRRPTQSRGSKVENDFCGSPKQPRESRGRSRTLSDPGKSRSFAGVLHYHKRYRKELLSGKFGAEPRNLPPNDLTLKRKALKGSCSTDWRKVGDRSSPVISSPNGDE